MVNLRSETRSAYLLGVAVGESGRRSTVQLAEEFARTTDSTIGSVPGLAKLLRMGEVPLRLYLTLVMMTRGVDKRNPEAPHPLHRLTPPAFFAEMLGYDQLEDLDAVPGAGTRRVHRALMSLEKEGFVVLTKRPRHHAEISVVHPAGGKHVAPYITIPIELWSKQWITHLSARALAVYVAGRLLTVGKPSTDGLVIDPYRRKRFEFSDDTWQRGSKELVDDGLLDVRSGTVRIRELPERHRSLYYFDFERVRLHRPGDPL